MTGLEACIPILWLCESALHAKCEFLTTVCCLTFENIPLTTYLGAPCISFEASLV